MERLNKTSPTVKVTAEQKKQLAELESRYAAKIAERELALKTEITKATEGGEFEKAEPLEQQLVKERKALRVELEEKRKEVREGKRG